MDVDDLLRQVRGLFGAAGGDDLHWPDPHPDRSVADEDYSRVTDPGKYRIVTVRARAWITTLVDSGVATAEAVPDVRRAWRDGSSHPTGTAEATWLRPRAVGAIPLLLSLHRVHEAEHDYLVVGAGDPAVEVDLVPDCGCDACDSGSTDLLDVIDARVLDVVTGALTHVRLPTGAICGRRDGWSATWSGQASPDRQELEALIAQARAGRSPHPVVHGRPWW